MSSILIIFLMAGWLGGYLSTIVFLGGPYEEAQEIAPTSIYIISLFWPVALPIRLVQLRKAKRLQQIDQDFEAVLVMIGVTPLCGACGHPKHLGQALCNVRTEIDDHLCNCKTLAPLK